MLRLSPSMEPSSRGRAAFWMVAILVITTLANVAIGQIVPRQARPVIVRDGGSLFDLATSGQRSVGHRYGFYLAMGETEGAKLITFPRSGVNRVLLRAFGGMELEGSQYEPTGHDLPPLGEPLGELETDGGEIVPYWVIPGEPDDTYWIATYEDGYVAVAGSVMPFPGGGS